MILNNLVEDKKKIFSFFKNKKYKKVVKYGIILLKKNSNDLYILNLVGMSLIYLQNFIESQKYFKKILSIKQTPELFYNYGKILKKLNKYKEAIIYFEKAISLSPKFSEAYNILGNTKKILNENQEAIKNYEKAIEAKKNNIHAYFNLAKILKENKKYEDSKKIYEKILTINENNYHALNDLGAINSILGKLDFGRNYFISALKENPLFFDSYKNYIDITKIDSKDKIFKALENISFKNLNDKDKITIFYSLSKGYFDQKKNKIGFEFLEKAKVLKKKNSSFSMNGQQKLFKNIKSFFNDNHLKKIENKIKIKKNPIFIVGMPRSGTTLIEQILSSHPEVFGAGELNYLPIIIDEINFNKKKYENVINKIRLEYSERLLKLSHKKYIIDKLPMNFKWIGFILKAFPEAKVIHLERNPMAVCWSNYKINFNDSGMDFNLNQKDIASYYILYNNLMKFWFQNFNSKIIRINYDEFVCNHKIKIKEIISKLNLKWEDSLNNHYKNERPIETASLHQARGKIIKNSSKQWKSYEVFLKPMQNMLKENNIAF